MPKLDVINTEGKKVGEIKIPEIMLQLAKGEGIIHEVVRMRRARTRQGTASTKGRSEVKASGRKPWRQKGTGRARAGDRGSPIWRGGGVIFGPKPRSFSFSVPKRVKRKALKSVLAIRFQKGQVVVLDDIKLDEPKTKDLVGVLAKVGAGDSVLILKTHRDKNLHLAARNLPGVEAVGIRDLNTYSVIIHKRLLVTREALEHLQAWMGKIK